MAARQRCRVSALPGEPGTARPLFERTVDLRRSRLGADHPYTLRSATNLALTLRALGHYEQGRQLGEDTLHRMRRVLGDDHPQTLRAAHSLAAVLGRIG